MLIPARIQYHFFSSKIALYRDKMLKVQNNNNGTSGVELKEMMEIKIVDANNITLLDNRGFDRKREANL
tara:strand:+ start:569 stop:775 length:207 start_codon:yes stop_codon:yes gene_type:complete